jgi:hypothetical protein
MDSKTRFISSFNMNFVRIVGIFSALAVSFLGFSHVVVAQEVEQATLPNCYMQTESGKIIDLVQLCGGGTSASVYQEDNYAGGYSSNSYSGNCQYSWQVDSSGKPCGSSSASNRPDYSPSYTPSYTGSSGGTYVRSYTRSNGTSVRGHWRGR